MRRMTATDAARAFSDLLDSIERTGETVVVERRGRAVAAISPAASVSGLKLKELLRDEAPDLGWPAELAEVRSMLVTEERPWNG